MDLCDILDIAARRVLVLALNINQETVFVLLRRI